MDVDISNQKIAYFSEFINHKGLDSNIKNQFLEKIDSLKNNGHTVEPVSFPYLDFLVPTYYVLSTAEASSNLSRFDGINYGYRSDNSNSLEDTYINTRSEGFGEEVKRRIMLGTFVLSAGYHDAYFTKAQKVRRLIKEKLEEILSSYDFVITPTTPNVAFKIGNEVADPTQMYLEDIYTVLANLTGCPAISVPSKTFSNSMPHAFQLIAKKFEEEKLLSFSKAYL